MNINKLKEIVENAPEGATHFDGDHYWKMTNEDHNFIWESEFWNPVISFTGDFSFRSLEDIRTIIELYEALNNVSKSHQEPKDHGSWYTECNGCGEDIDRYEHESDCPFKLLERFE